MSLERNTPAVKNKEPKDRKKTNSKVGKCTKYLMIPFIQAKAIVLKIMYRMEGCSAFNDRVLMSKYPFLRWIRRNIALE